VAGFSLRRHRWRDVWVVDVRGDIDVGAAAELNRTLTKLQRESTVYVDLWDVTYFDPICLGVLATAARRAKETRWDFALIAPAGGVAVQEIEAAGLEELLRPFDTKSDALAALRGL
jgi:anti-anti-sigma factor